MEKSNLLASILQAQLIGTAARQYASSMSDLHMVRYKSIVGILEIPKNERIGRPKEKKTRKRKESQAPPRCMDASTTLPFMHENGHQMLTFSSSCLFSASLQHFDAVPCPFSYQGRAVEPCHRDRTTVSCVCPALFLCLRRCPLLPSLSHFLPFLPLGSPCRLFLPISWTTWWPIHLWY